MGKRKRIRQMFVAVLLCAVFMTGVPEYSYASDADDQNAVKNAEKMINIPHMDDIRGNITLPESLAGASITWKSDHPDVITDTKKDGKAAGVVTRGDSDTDVVLTATIKKGNAESNVDYNLTVKKAYEKPAEEDFTAYLFGSFTGSEGNNMDEQIYFAVSEDGYNYVDLNNAKPVLVSKIGEKGVRDPYILRSVEGDRFFLIATDLSIFYRGGWGRANATVTGSHNLVCWESTDLVNWSEPRLIKVASSDAGCAWAPEAIYNDKTGEYVIYFAESTVVNGNVSGKMCIYAVRTRDFVNFSDAEKYIISPGRDIIDTSIYKADDGYYYRASKDGENGDRQGSIRIDKCDDLFGDWQTITSLGKLGFNRDMNNTSLEGPEIFRFNRKDWKDDKPTYGVYSDRYMEGTGYLPVVTTDFNDINNSKHSWELLPDGSFFFDSLKKRHGTIMNITTEEYFRILKAYANDEMPARDEEVKQSSILRCDFEDKSSVPFKLNGKASVVYDNDKKSNVMSLDGSTNTFAEFPEKFFDGRNSFTITMDMKAENVSGNYFTFGLGADNNRYMFFKAADTSRLSIAKNGSRYEQSVSGQTNLLNKWVNVTIVLSESETGMCTMKLFIHGKKIGEKNTYFKPTIFGENLPAYIGKSFYNGDSFFKGKFDNIIVYNQALPDEEISDYVKSGQIVDYDIEFESKVLAINNVRFDRANKTITLFSDWKDLSGDLKKCDVSVKVNNGAKILSDSDIEYVPNDSFTFRVKSAEGFETEWTVNTVIGNNPIPPEEVKETPVPKGDEKSSETGKENNINKNTENKSSGEISLDVKSSITIGVKEKLTVKADKAVLWTSDNPDVVSVDADGNIKGLKTGKAVITATASDGGFSKIDVTVKKAPAKITVSPKSKTVRKGKKFRIKVKLPKQSASYRISFKSRKKSIASVSKAGIVKAKKKGKTVITVKTFNNKKAKVKVKVK